MGPIQAYICDHCGIWFGAGEGRHMKGPDKDFCCEACEDAYRIVEIEGVLEVEYQ
jgi:hypothetical protein